MRTIIALLILYSVLLGSTLVFAQPLVTSNVHVMQNATAAQCTSSWNGTAGNVTNEITTGYGQSNSVATTAIQSCTGCAIDSKSHDCVCNRCYAYSN